MHPEIEKLIDLALADGQITEKERNVILKKSAELGVDTDEVEMVLDGRLHQLEASKPKEKEKVGNIKTCPACGASVKAFQIKCDDCGHEFTGIESNKTISVLFEKINSLKLRNNEYEFELDERIAKLISNTPIPNSKEDLIEFLTVCSSQCNETNFMKSADPIPSAWAQKGKEALSKAKISFYNDDQILKLLNEFELQFKKNSKKSNLLWVFIFIVLFFIFSFVGIIIVFGPK